MDNKSFKRSREASTIDEKSMVHIKGFPIFQDMKLSDLIKNYENLGYQASHLSKACKIIKNMKDSDSKIFLSFTSNMISSGLREIIAQLCKEKKVHCIITSTGSIEEDFMKASSPFLLGNFHMDDNEVKSNKMNRIGNILVPDESYCKFEDFNMDFMKELCNKKLSWSPSEYCRELGLKLSDKNSFLYWCSKNDIPIIVPGIVDGAIGDHIYFYNKKTDKKFIFDVNADIEKFYDLILEPDKISGIILGGGIAKHHLIGAAILRDGLDYAVYVSTATEYDGSLSGAKPTEATSWNKLKNIKNSAFIESDASLVTPFLAHALLY
jgi:deoxyhypusine synthase